MLYITLLDQFHPGIYSSQVVDVCDHINKNHQRKIRILAFLSIKELIRTNARKELRKISPTALIYPSFPGLRYFELTAIFLFFICLFTGERVAICRNVFCTKMALRIRSWGLLNKVILDGRSAMAAEIEEYDVFPVPYLRKNIRAIESFSVLNADYRIAVSSKLISYWRDNYGYSKGDHVVIPCTLDSKYFSANDRLLSEKSIDKRKELGFQPKDIILVYSGSNAPWQSFALLKEFLEEVFTRNNNTKCLFLSKENSEIEELKNKYPTRIVCKWLQQSQVPKYLSICDYGILLREQSITNKVASPVKFAEYLSCGLKVVISNNLGDLTEFVRDHNVGYIYSKGSTINLNEVENSEKQRIVRFAKENFGKDSPSILNSYEALLSKI